MVGGLVEESRLADWSLIVWLEEGQVRVELGGAVTQPHGINVARDDVAQLLLRRIAVFVICISMRQTIKQP